MMLFLFISGVQFLEIARRSTILYVEREIELARKKID